MDGWRGISLKGFNKCQRKKNEKTRGEVGDRLGSVPAVIH